MRYLKTNILYKNEIDCRMYKCKYYEWSLGLDPFFRNGFKFYV